MFLFSIVISLGLGLLFLANWVAFRGTSPVVVIIGLCLVFLLVPQFFALASPPLVCLTLLLPVGLLIWKLTERGPRFFLWLSLAAFLLAFGMTSAVAYKNEQEYYRLRALYPFESMESRLPQPKPASRVISLSPAAQSRLAREEDPGHFSDWRARRLKRLHENSVDLFLRNYGFGVGRMISRVPNEANLAFGMERVSLLQPGPRISLTGSPGEWGQPSLKATDSLGRLHDTSLFKFLDPETFGYIKDRRNVAGFVAHRFRDVPEWPDSPKLQTLDLVGLLLHDEPRAYVSANLPRMDELRQAPTRPLDPFETVALASLQSGDDLSIVKKDNLIRMLGAIRSNKHCVACHGGESGDLLGAFSSTLEDQDKGLDPVSVP